ncbi:DinB family protein [Membranihabitans marinus]
MWQALPSDFYSWRPDDEAMSALEMVRHVLQADYGWNIIINRGDMSNFKTPWDHRPLLNVQDEIDFAEPYRLQFLNSIKSFSDKDLSDITIIHPGNMEKKNLGSYLLRIAYHESVHGGQFMSYLRSMGLERPLIWD